MKQETCVQEKTNQKHNEKNVAKSTPEPPDGGWGWVVVLASFLCHFVIDGIAYSFGVFLPKFEEFYDASKGKVSWVGSLLYGCYLMTGPMANTLTNRYGCRIVTITGSVVCCLAFLLSTQAPSVETLMVSCGVMGGIGFGLIFLPAIVSVGSYFSKKRALATGIAVCGSGVGTLVFAPVCHKLLDTYDWRVVITILSGTCLSCMLYGGLMRPLEARSRQKQTLSSKGTENKETRVSEDTCEFQSIAYKQAEKTTEGQPTDEIRNEERAGRATILFQNKTSEKNVIWVCWSSERRKQSLKDDMSDVLGDISVPKGSIVIDLSAANTLVRSKSEACQSLWNVWRKITSNMSNIIDFSLLRNKAFLLVCFASAICMIGFPIPYVYIVDSSIMKGISSDKAAFLLSVIGIANIIGRMFFGCLSDRPSVNSLLINSITATLTGLCVICVPFCSTYEAILCDCILFGFISAPLTSLTSIILVELFGLDQLSNSFGLLSLFRGGSCILGPPIAGFLYDTTRSNDIPFYVSGTLLIISSALTFMVPVVQKHFADGKSDIPTMALHETENNAITEYVQCVV